MTKAKSETNSNGESQPIGWEAITAALERIYGEQEPRHYGTVVPAMLGGDDPLQGISIYRAETPPHFHYVTYGFSELYEKESNDPAFSGFGFELTFRLAARAGESEPPVWPISFLQNLARYVFRTGNFFDERHHSPLNGKIALEEETLITAIFFKLDPQLGEMQTDNGRVKFLQIVGLCDDEYALLKQGRFDAITERVLSLLPLGITDIYRPSILDTPDAAAAVLAAPPENKQAAVYGTVATWHSAADKLHVQLGATIVRDLVLLLDDPLSHGDRFFVYGAKTAIVFEPSDAFAWREEDGVLFLQIPDDSRGPFLTALRPQRGVYSCQELPGVDFEVVPIEIKDRHGKVLEVVG